MYRLKYSLILGVISLVSILASCGSKPAETESREKASAEVSSPAETAPLLKSADGLPMLVDFSASWCQPCQMLKPEFQKASKAMKGKVEFKTIDVDENQALAAEFGVQSVPTLVLLSAEGKEISRRVGYMDNVEIEQLAKSAL